MFADAIDRAYSFQSARTIALHTSVVMELFHRFFIRSIHGTFLAWKTLRATKAMGMTVIVTGVAQSAITGLPPPQTVFSTVCIPFGNRVLIVEMGVALFAIIETENRSVVRGG